MEKTASGGEMSAKELKALIIESGITFEKCAQLCGRTVQTIYNYTSGITKVPPDVPFKLRLVSDYLNRRLDSKDYIGIIMNYTQLKEL